LSFYFRLVLTPNISMPVFVVSIGAGGGYVEQSV